MGANPTHKVTEEPPNLEEFHKERATDGKCQAGVETVLLQRQQRNSGKDSANQRRFKIFSSSHYMPASYSCLSTLY